jgi:ribosomal protein L32
MNEPNQCPRCGTSKLRSWNELRDEDREVVKRLPASADYSLAERQARHRWCPRCWYEETSGQPQNI